MEQTSTLSCEAARTYENIRARAIRILERLPPCASEIASVLWACLLLAEIGKLAEMDNNPLDPYGFSELEEASTLYELWSLFHSCGRHRLGDIVWETPMDLAPEVVPVSIYNSNLMDKNSFLGCVSFAM